ncbi:hypothetical protein AN958_00060, partial [Leucoagaricus sp. SymC.cos]
GADIPDIEQVVQLGVPSSLSTWIQRAGRAGRSAIRARAVLLVEKSVFERIRRKPSGTQSRDVTSTTTIEGSDDNYQWKKQVDPNVREWVETPGCRRKVSNKHFDNPPSSQEGKVYLLHHICL